MVTKAEQYEWAVPGDKGRFERIPIGELHVDRSYQREELPQHALMPMVRDFSWSAFGTATVMRRATGKNYIVDGQQRTAAARIHGGIETVPCMVFESDGVAREALAFCLLNMGRKAVRAEKKFLARVCAKCEPEVAIMRWLRENEIAFALNGHTGGACGFASCLVGHWKKSEAHSKAALLLQKAITSGRDPMHTQVHRGLFYLFKHGIDLQSEVGKLIQRGGIPGMASEIRKLQIELGGKTGSGQLCGLAILRVINFRRHRKIRIEDGTIERGEE